MRKNDASDNIVAVRQIGSKSFTWTDAAIQNDTSLLCDSRTKLALTLLYRNTTSSDGTTEYLAYHTVFYQPPPTSGSTTSPIWQYPTNWSDVSQNRSPGAIPVSPSFEDSRRTYELGHSFTASLMEGSVALPVINVFIPYNLSSLAVLRTRPWSYKGSAESARMKDFDLRKLTH